MTTTPDIYRSTTDILDSRSEADYYECDVHHETNAHGFYYNTHDIICNMIDQTIISASNGVKNKESVVRQTPNEPACIMNRNKLESLKNSTKKLYCLLEDVQAKTHSTALVNDDPPKMADILRPMANWLSDRCDMPDQSVTDIIGSAAIKRLEKQTQDLESIVITDKEDDCSVYKRLTRKCHCLNQQEYNDFIIHFNEDTKFSTDTVGEIIKNMFILKKFLYMGGIYTKNALRFLNQGLEEGTYSEKAEIIQSCAFADVCCVFDTHTIVKVCISWPCKNPSCVDEDTQEMAAKFLYNLCRLEEGQRYLNLNAKITCDIKKLLKKKQDQISCDTVEMLSSVLSLCEPKVLRSGLNSLTYHCRPMQEDIGIKTLNALTAYRQHMTLNELFSHLEILLNLSGNEETRLKLIPQLPSMLTLFKNILLEFNNCDMNIVITNIMNNIVGESVAKTNEREAAIAAGERITSCIATEPIEKKNAKIQVPVEKKSHKKARHHRKEKVSHLTIPGVVNSRKKDIEDAKHQGNSKGRTVIVVPVEEEKSAVQ